MSLFVVHYDYSSETASARQRVRPDHAAYLAELERDGVLVLSGPYTDGTGALFIVRADGVAECERWFEADPFAFAGLVEDRRIQQFLVGFGLPEETDRAVRPPFPQS